jgi:fucose 4-O-acetylase-like acetyltransferase
MGKDKRIDAARGIGILSVIIFHSGFLPFVQITEPLLMSWMLSVFVFTGGWLLKSTSFRKSNLVTISKRLLIPFFIAGTISFLGWLILRNIYPENVIKVPIIPEVIKWMTGRNPYFDSPLWFIPTYFLASLFMQLISVWFLKRQVIIKSILSIIFVSAGFFISKQYVYPTFSYDLILLFIGIMMMGSVASTIKIPKLKHRALIDFLIFISFVALTLSNGYIDMFQREFGNKLVFFISGGLGTYSVSRLAIYGLNIKNNLILEISKLGKSSMTLLVWHWPIMQWLTYVFFVSGFLKYIATSYTKTSFIIRGEGIQLIVSQIIFCLVYSIIAVYLTVKVRSVKLQCLYILQKHML